MIKIKNLFHLIVISAIITPCMFHLQNASADGLDKNNTFFRPLDYAFKNGLNTRIHWVGSSAESIGASFSPTADSVKLSFEAIQASSTSIGQSSTSLGSSDTLNTSNPLGGGTKMEEAVKKAKETMKPVSSLEQYSQEKEKRIREARNRFKNPTHLDK